MSLYREPGRRSGLTFVAIAVGFALLGGLAGFLIGSSGEEEASLGDALAEVQGEVRPALGELELVEIEYGEGVRDGEVVAESEYQASLDHAERAREVVSANAEDLRLLSPQDLAGAESALTELVGLVEDRAAPARVGAAVAGSDAAIRAAARIER
jgi:hypothetical protein